MTHSPWDNMDQGQVNRFICIVFLLHINFYVFPEMYGRRALVIIYFIYFVRIFSPQLRLLTLTASTKNLRLILLSVFDRHEDFMSQNCK